jgi:hypothetical protein
MPLAGLPLRASCALNSKAVPTYAGRGRRRAPWGGVPRQQVVRQAAQMLRLRPWARLRRSARPPGWRSRPRGTRRGCRCRCQPGASSRSAWSTCCRCRSIRAGNSGRWASSGPGRTHLCGGGGEGSWLEATRIRDAHRARCTGRRLYAVCLGLTSSMGFVCRQPEAWAFVPLLQTTISHAHACRPSQEGRGATIQATAWISY